MCLAYVAFPGPGNIYKQNLAPIAFWSMQARHRPFKAVVADSEVLVAVFVRICRYGIVAVKLQWAFTAITHHKTKIVLFMTIVTYLAPMGVGSFVKPQVC